ncbi:S41 family peptidase [Marinilabilia sp.]|uniref:S41 family peptidase n=1 Tax=Marinilabilia sp. TaxID=2021252 RepID=UPI0025BA8BE5|nr:S41 family peptidase [Marinilabilia sp.]
MKHPFSLLFISLFSIVFLTYCSEDENKIVEPVVEENEEEKESIDPQTLMINNFIKNNMEYYYFWNDEIPDIDQEKEENSSDYFDKLLKKPDDRWSFITDDYPALVKYFSGVEKSTGYSLQLMYLNQTSNQVIAVIEYVHPDTPAEEAGLKRGDIIVKIDGLLITDENYSDLLGRTMFEITLGEINLNGSTSDLNPTIPVEAIELSLNPIVKTNIIDTLGHKIGYLAYTSFIFDYNQELETVIREFKDAGVTDMILDLRYNGGGAVSSAELLGNMLVPPGNDGRTFIKSVYNTDITNDIKSEPDYTPDFFLRKFSEHENNLNINKLYVFTTESTASASEMIIYGLSPYMEVVQIGTQTHGKYYASITISDEEKHDWAMQPIIMRSINALDDIDYSQGLIPDYELMDDFYNYPENELGHHRERFMSEAISQITGQTSYYDQNAGVVKSANSLLRKADKLRQKLYPNRSKMWISVDELPGI